MKKHILWIACCSGFLFASAQPVLNSNEMLPYGSIIHFKYSQSFSVIDTTMQGANATWNFSALVNDITQQDLTDTMVNPALTPYGAIFPTANYAYSEVQGTATAYRYFNKTTTKMERVGSYTSAINTYNDPQIEYVFPLQLGASSFDTWDNTNSSSGGTYDLVCIGYGTLVLPSHTYSNALMVRARVTEGSLYDFPIYFWYSSDNGSPLLEYIVGDGFFIGSNILFINSMSVAGVDENNLMSVIRFNNPVQDHFNLVFRSVTTGNVTCTVLNETGEALAVETIRTEALAEQNLTLDFNAYPEGLYFILLEDRQSGEKSKLIRIVKL